jgi:hypothetical protein
MRGGWHPAARAPVGGGAYDYRRGNPQNIAEIRQRFANASSDTLRPELRWYLIPGSAVC